MQRRKRKLVRLDMQLKVVLVTLLVACLSLLVNFQLSMASVWSLNGRFPDSPSAAAALESVRLALINRFILAVVVAVPLAAAIGIVFSSKFAGPIFCFKRHFMEMLNGRWDQQLSLRTGDDLHDVSGVINEALDLLRARLRAHQEIFKDLEAYFSGADSVAGGKSLELLMQLRQRLASEQAAFEARFPSTVGTRNLASAELQPASPEPVSV